MDQVAKLLHFVRPYWKKALLSLFLLAAVVLMDLAIPRLVQRIIDQGIGQKDMRVVLTTSAWMLSISLLSTLFAVGNNNFSIQVGESVARDLREALFLHIQDFSFGNLDRMQTGQLIVRLTSDTGAFQRLVQVTLRIGTRAPLLMIGSLILMFNTDRSLALKVLPILFLTSGVIIFFVSRMGPLFMQVQRRLDRLNNVLQENIAGVRVVKAFVRADHESQRFGETNTDFTLFNTKVMQFMSSMGPTLSILLNIGIVLVIWSGGLQAIGGEITTGQLVAFVNYLQTTLGPLMIMAMLANTWAAGIASADRINEVLDTLPEVREVLESPAQADGAPQSTTAQAKVGQTPAVAFENVSFHYQGSGDGTVLEGINLNAQRGQTVAILGATGAGKTSLVNLIPRFYDVSGGRVCLDGVDVRQAQPEELLGKIGVVPQETVLFSGSVRDNIRYGRPGASEEEVLAAAKAAQAHEFILELPQGYDTHVEQRGVNLSGGQKQRIAIARALLLRPEILILDDATSSVDVETETKIQDALELWMGHSTRFVVAQRISTVLKADKIIVIEKGRIAAEGSHSELMRTSRVYQEIYASQLGEGVNAGD